MDICIIKLGAKGDVIRTLPLLVGLKNKFPDARITWITRQSSVDIIKTSPFIDEVITIPFVDSIKNFDILYNFDVDEEATALAEKIKANKKYGFYSENNFVSSFNLGGEYYLSTLYDDEIKKTNKKTYQEMMFDVAELPYHREHHSIYLSDEDKRYAEQFIKKNNIEKNKLIGIHLGAADRWPSKKWHRDNLIEFIKKANNEDYTLLLFGGSNEIDEHKIIFNLLQNKDVSVFRNDPNNSDLEFASLVDVCGVMICSDSYALHVSLALKKPTVGLFFCTPAKEIEGYDLLIKLVSPRLYEFFPEKMDVYDEELTKSISEDNVLQAVEKIL